MKSSINISKENNKENESAKQNPIIENINSKYILSKIYDNMTIKKKLEIVKYNKKIQNRINLSVNDYKEYSETFTPIEIEIIPTKGKYGKFININKNDKLYYHIYFNDNKEEIKDKYRINEEDKVTKIKIIVDYKVTSFRKLFYKCYCIESINFKKFYRNNITDMSFMFFCCSSLNDLNINNFNTNNVINMACMFAGCSSLKELNSTHFNTNNVTNMCEMFDGCSSLKKLNFTNFNTNNVTNMSFMFFKCLSLKELNLTNFNTNNAIDTKGMFFKCSSLIELNSTHFNTNNITNIRGMFYGCSDDLKMKIKSENKNIKDEAF